MKQLLIVLTIIVLTVVAITRPWHRLNKALDITTAMDSLRADTLQAHQPDSLFIAPNVAITLPQIISDSLSYTIYARRKKKAYLEEQSKLLQLENSQKQARFDSLRHRKKPKIIDDLSEAHLNRLLNKQNGKATRRNATDLEVSDLETELNQRHYQKSNP